MARNGLVLALVLAAGALLLAGAQPATSQRGAAQADARQKWEYLRLAFPSGEVCTAQGAGLDFAGTRVELARKLNIKLGDPNKEGTEDKLIIDSMNYFGAAGWELSVSDTATYYDNIDRAYVFKRLR